MSDDIEIRSGGAIAVDTSSLRHVAAVVAQLADDCGDADGWLRRAQQAAMAAALPSPFPVVRLDHAAARARDLASSLRRRAEVYEEVERAVGVLFTDGRAAAVTGDARKLLDQWRAGRHAEVEHQLLGAVAPLWRLQLALSTMLYGVRAVGLGVIPRTAPPLAGDAPPVEVSELSRGPATPPASLRDLATRIPGADGSRVRIETYAGSGGDPHHVVYIAGTQTWEPSTDDPWDMTSNLQLYARRMSASYAAVEQALFEAGVHEGDAVHIVGHSQGGMLATHLARQGAYDVRSLVTFASPVQAELPEDVLQVTLRHADDAVAALAAGGSPAVAGSPGSFIVERVADPRPRPGDLRMEVHQMDAYLGTAKLADESGDPRVGEFHRRLGALSAGAAGGAATAVVYGARRETVSRPFAPGSGRSPRVSAASSAAGAG